ncbi:MAG TPA: DUF192 domain-containing protein [Croceibacterium sp.]|jgi:hypothetical protein
MRWTLPTILASFALAAGACSPQTTTAASTPQQVAPTKHPISGLDVIPLTISQNGNTHAFRVEVARTDAEQQKGLMFRTKMGKDEGMLFPSPYPEARSFWMKNTVIPLDIVFIGTDHRISNVAANAVPYSEAPINSAGETIAVLELNGGRAAELGFTPGALVSW